MNATAPEGEPCLCGSGTGYLECCGPLHLGERAAETALALMRSRFTAFALGDESYLLSTWHPRTRPRGVDLDRDVAWRRLQIVDTEGGARDDSSGVVEFRAQYVRHGKRHIMQERSRFTKEKDRWLYVDGDLTS
ncbi:YchJ family protein [Mycobacterium vicinigordonae]|uniref:UPF0225 protein H0P51_00735 n=1 Tax=Mycobacterium vicinigordonae TaxID=1719132 RepID=A0A7D6HQE9_9MYCO|nr:YchJ family metal-binding protein [Mycobacterium vicinigordonae]QLL07591.1 hypothetical protein H0P51_00735 [Mycobacterium vicinigordonae]